LVEVDHRRFVVLAVARARLEEDRLERELEAKARDPRLLVAALTEAGRDDLGLLGRALRLVLGLAPRRLTVLRPDARRRGREGSEDEKRGREPRSGSHARGSYHAFGPPRDPRQTAEPAVRRASRNRPRAPHVEGYRGSPLQRSPSEDGEGRSRSF